MGTIQDKLKQAGDASIQRLAQGILDPEDDRAALAFATCTMARMNMELLDKLTIIHSEQIALSNQMLDLKKQQNEKKIILPNNVH